MTLCAEQKGEAFLKKIFILMMVLLTIIMTGCMGESGSDNAKAVNDKESKKQAELHVAAAASLTDVMKELAEEYSKENPDVTITFNFGSSGALQQAIENGGQTDIFYSAGKKQMDALDKAGLLAEGTKKDLLINEVVLIVPADGGQDLKSFEDLKKKSIRKIAIGGEGVPVGQYTQEIFKSLKFGEEVEMKEVLGTDVRQVLSWIAGCEADAGVVYATDASINKDVRVICKAPEGSHKPIIYPAAVLKETKNLEEAKAFLAFTGSEKAKKIFQKYGFEVK